MDWSNLLSGTVGAVIGVAGALASTLLATNRAARQELERADRIAVAAAFQMRQAKALEVSAALANLLVTFYEDLRKAQTAERQSADTVDTSDVLESAAALRRAITVDAPLLRGDLAEEMKVARKKIKQVIGRHPSEILEADLVDLLDIVMKAGDQLRDLRQNVYGSLGSGARLGDVADVSQEDVANQR